MRLERTMILLVLMFIFTPLISCKQDGWSEEMLWLRHQNADMPIWVRGNFDSDVILLVVHGGAGGNSGVYVSDFKTTLEPDYMVAYWDQRHAGSSKGAFSKDDFSPDNALDLMSLDMKLTIDMLRTHYGEDKKIFALGHSWGVQLGTKYLVDHGDLGQLTGWIASNGPHSAPEEYSARLDFIEKWATEMDEKGLELEITIYDPDVEFHSPAEVAQWARDNDPIQTWDQVRDAWILGTKLQNAYVIPTYVSPKLDAVSDSTYFGEVYTLGPYSRTTNLVNQVRTGTLINNSNKQTSIQEFYDLTPQMNTITLPTALLWGHFDHISGVSSAEAYRDAISTPPEDIMLETYDAAHSPMYEQNTAFINDLKAFIETHRKTCDSLAGCSSQ